MPVWRKPASAPVARSMPCHSLRLSTELERHLFQPERLSVVLDELIRRYSQTAASLHIEETRLRKALRKAETQIDRMMDAVAEGLVGNSDGFRRKLSTLEQQREDTTSSQRPQASP